MAFQDLRAFLESLEQRGQLIHVDERLSPRYEIGAALRELGQTDERAVLFEKVDGYPIPIVGNLLGSEQLLATALGIERDLVESYRARVYTHIKPTLTDKSPAREVILRDDIDILRTLPVLTHHEKDAGPYFTSSITVARDPETGLRGMGLHRIQVKGRDKVGLLLATPPLSDFLRKAAERGQPLDIAIVNGVDPAIFLASISRFQPGVDKFEVAGGLRGEPVELVKCETIDVEVPAQAEFVLEGQILPGVWEDEGPFGESSGYYLTFQNPVTKINLIAHRKNPMYHALMPFTRENKLLSTFLWQANYFQDLKAKLPCLKRVSLSSFCGEHLFLQIEKQTESDGKEAINAVFDLASSIKGVVVVDEDVDIDNLEEVEWAVATRSQPDRDLVVISAAPGFKLDPSVRGGATSKWGVDATKPLEERERFEKIKVPEEVSAKVKQVLSRLGR